jgi:hypothetical protein
VSLAIAGTAVWGVGLAYELRASRLDNEAASVDGSSAEAERLGRQIDQASTISWVGSAGGVLAAAAVPLMTRPRSRVPWWGVALGGAGLASAGVGVWQLAVSRDCELPSEEGACFSYRGTERLGTLLLSAAAPLLTLPLVQLLQRTRASVTVSLNATGARDVGIRFSAWQ